MQFTHSTFSAYGSVKLQKHKIRNFYNWNGLCLTQKILVLVTECLILTLKISLSFITSFGRFCSKKYNSLNLFFETWQDNKIIRSG